MKVVRFTLCLLLFAVMLTSCESSSSDSGFFPIIVNSEPNHAIAITEDGLQIKAFTEKSWTKIDGASGKTWTTLKQVRGGALLGSAYTGTFFDKKGEGISRSEDFGKTWTIAAETKGNTFSQLTELSNGWVISESYGIWLSENQGKSWTKTYIPAEAFASVSLIGVCADGSIIARELVLDSTAGIGAYKLNILRSADNGKTWSNVYSSDFRMSLSNLSEVIFGSTVMIHSPKLDTTSVTTISTFIRSDDNGLTWRTTVAGMGSNTYLNGFTRYTDGTLIGQALSTTTGSTYSVWKSADTGLNWTQAYASSSFAVGDLIAIHDNSVLGTGTAINGNAAFRMGVYKSSDKGATWRDVGSPFKCGDRVEGVLTICSMSISGSIDKKVYAIKYSATGTGTEGELWRSDDAGETWTQELLHNKSIEGIVHIRK